MTKKWDDIDKLIDDDFLRDYFDKIKDRKRFEDEINKNFNIGKYKDKKKDKEWLGRFRKRFEYINGRIVLKRGYVFMDDYDNKGRSDMKELYINRGKLKNVKNIFSFKYNRWIVISLVVLFVLIRIVSRIL